MSKKFFTFRNQYKGHDLIKITDGEYPVISFGAKKARAILACIDEIKAFVQECDDKGKSIEDILAEMEVNSES